MSVEIDTSALDKLMGEWDKLLERFPQEKRALLSGIRSKMLEAVREGIGNGKVARWQAPHTGGGGGYVAVRPKADTYQRTKSGKAYAVGYITNAIEGGHRHGCPRGGSSRGYRYRPRYKTPAVPGKWFYDAVRRTLPDMAESEVQRLLDIIADGLEGRL